MPDTLLDHDNDLLEELFAADGKWVIVNSHPTPARAIGAFASEADAVQFRNAYLPSYHVVELMDPEDVMMERKANERGH